MFCTKCGAQLQDGVKFCTSCGSPLDAPDDGRVPVDPETTTLDLEAAGFAPDVPADAPGEEPTVVQGLGATRVAPRVQSASAAPGMPASVPQAPAYDGSAYPNGPRKSGGGLVVAAAIMGVLAVIAVAAFVVVVIDPFGLGILGGAQSEPAAQVQVEDEGEAESEEAEDRDEASDESAEEPEAPAEEEPEAPAEQPAEEPEAPAEEPEAPAEQPAEEEPTVQDDDPATSGTFVLPDSSSRLYSTSELEGLSNWDLYVARNEIYARHGRRFHKDDLQSYFNGQSWYTPLYSPEQFDSMGLLSSIEQQNASTILSLEQARGSQYI